MSVTAGAVETKVINSSDGEVDEAAAAAAAAAAVAAASAAVVRGQMGEGTKDPDAVKLFIGQVPKTIDETVLSPMFEPYGKIYELKIIRNKQTGAHCGCAFLTYCKRSSAEAALKNMHNVHQLQGCAHPMQVRYAEGQTHLINGEHKLFIGMVPKQATVDDLRTLFKPFGEIVDATILYDNDQNSKGCGFIKFSQRESATEAINALHHKHVMQGGASPLVVKWADTAQQKMQKMRGPPMGFRPGMPMFAPPPYFPYNPFQAGPPIPGPMGSMGSTMPPVGGPGSMPPMPGGPMPPMPGGPMPPMGMNAQPPPMNAPYNGGQGGGLSNQYNPYAPSQGHSAAGAGLLAGQSGKISGPEGSNLFIRSLPLEWGDNDLFMAFSPFGSILSTKVVSDPHTGMSRCFGFVSFDNPQSAQVAIQNMNGMQIGATRIKVELKAQRNRPY